MGAHVITGYTGARHITPAMDAAAYRAIHGADNYILAEGDMLKGSMPSINEFTILGGLVSMQGHLVRATQETLAIDICANGYERIDLIVMRFTHDSNTLIDAAQIMVLKGTEVQSGNTPVAPSYNTGVIDNGAAAVDMPLYKISLSGSSVTFEELAETAGSISSLEVIKVETSSFSSLPQTITDDRITAEHEVINSLLSDPSAQTGDWTVTTSDGSLTIAGSISGTTDVTLYLAVTR